MKSFKHKKDTCNISVVQSSDSSQSCLTYDVSHLVSDGTGRSDKRVVTLIIFHLHLKEPCDY